MKQPVGIFDSGIGGLSILNDLVKEFPNETFIYIADTKNNPYGNKKTEDIRRFVSNITNKLIEFNVKGIIIACNTASANSHHLKLNIPLVNMIKSTVDEIQDNHKDGEVLVLATKITVESKLYTKYLKDYNIIPIEVNVSSLIPLVEKLKLNETETKEEIFRLLSPYKNRNIKTIVHGCTHLSFLENHMKEIFPNAKYLSGSQGVSTKLKKELNNKLNHSSKGEVILYTTGDLEYFKKQVDTLNIKYSKIDQITVD